MRSRVDDTPDDYIVDLPQRIRRYIYSSDEKLRDEIIEHRVIDNRGDRAYKLAKSFFHDGENDPKEWEEYPYESLPHLKPSLKELVLELGQKWEEYPYKYLPDLHPSLKQLVLELGPGLVSNFFLTEKFMEAAQSKKATNENAYGYWQFVGNSVDDEGEFVPLNATREEEILKTELGEKVNTELERERKRQKANLQGAQTSSNANRSTEARQRQPSAGEDWKAEARHAMVLLGGKSMKVVDKTSRKKVTKEFYMCLNSWQEMPLVLVSEDYLTACGATVLFRPKVTEEDKAEYTENKNHIAYDACSLLEAEYENFDGSSGNLHNIMSVWFKDMENIEERPLDVAAPPWRCDDEDY